MILEKCVGDIEMEREKLCNIYSSQFDLPFQVVEDFFQELYIKLLENSQVQNVLLWFNKSLGNKCIDVLKKKEIRKRRIINPNSIDFSDKGYLETSNKKNNEEEYVLLEVSKGIDMLNERQQEIIMMRYWKNMSSKEIGKEMDIDWSAVDMTLLRARAKLRDYLSRSVGEYIRDLKKAG